MSSFRYLSGYQNNTEQPGAYIQLGARYYNPTIGAFTQTDPEPGNLTEPTPTSTAAATRLTSQIQRGVALIHFRVSATL